MLLKIRLALSFQNILIFHCFSILSFLIKFSIVSNLISILIYVWIILWRFSVNYYWGYFMTLGTLIGDTVKKSCKRFQFFFFFSFVYYVFVAKIWFSVGHYNLWKFNALFVYKNFQYYSITWMPFSYQGVLFLLWTNSHGPMLWSGSQLRYTINKSCVELLSWAKKYVDTTLLLLFRIQLITR